MSRHLILPALVNAPSVAGLVDDPLDQTRQPRLKLPPNPARQGLAGRVFQPFDIVEVVVVQPLIDRLKNIFDSRKIHDPTRFSSDRAANMNRYLERMTVEPATF